MAQRRIKQSTESGDYQQAVVCLGIGYDESFYDSGLSSPVVPIEEVQVRELPPFRYKGYKTVEPIEVIVRITQDNVIIRCSRVHIFTYANNYYSALENIKSLLIDYYIHLKKSKKNLARNLVKDLEYLENVFTRISK